MKRIIAKIGICTMAAGLLLSSGVLNAAEESAFWKKKEIEAPATEEAPEQTQPNSDGVRREDGASFVRYYRNANPERGVNGGQGQPAQQNQQNQQNQQVPSQQNQQNQQMPNQQDQQAPNQQNQQIPNQQGQQSQQGQAHPSDYAPGISQEIHKILANQSVITLDPNAYIVQHEDGLWLVMGNIRAKVDIMIYVDPKNMHEDQGQQQQQPENNSRAIPLYK